MARDGEPSPARAVGLRRNPALLFWKNFFQYGMFLNPAWALFLLSRGIDRADIFLLGVIYAAVTVCTEIPTGYVADRFGRRRTLVIGTVALVAGACLQIGAQGFLMLAAVMVLRSLGDALHSGTEEAIVVDSAHELGNEDEVLRDANVGSSGHHLAKAITPVAFMAVAAVLSDGMLYLALAALTAVASAAALAPIRKLTEPSHKRSRHGVKAAIAPFRAHPILWGFTLHGGMRFTAVLLFFMAYSARLGDLGAGTFWLGVFYGLFHLGMYAHSRIAWKLDRRYGAPKLVNGMTAACIALGLVVAFVDNAPVAFIAGLAAFVLADARGSYYVHHVNAFIPSDVRATTLSFMRLVQRAVEIPVMIAASALAAHGISWVFALFAALNLLLLIAPFPPLSRIEKAKQAISPPP